MVAVVGGPAEYKLAEVARSDDKTVFCVGYIHYDESSLPCLCVLIYNIVLF